MNWYYVTINENLQGYHIIHHMDCFRLPNPENRIFLGSFINSKGAILKAKDYYSRISICTNCCNVS
ncbi:hypothetical protein ACE1ET_05320 [Saccharicrinis sp. FJH62]|uniref:hypothetical protein n=1 Tax=Saccharicrinis sp. FJH62 TaxID=3344657 RepID=UPI0035D4F57B